MIAQDSQHIIQHYADLFGQLRPELLSELETVIADDIVFSDPFNLTYGSEKFIGIFAHMFNVMDEPQFEILDVSFSDRAGYIKWQMSGQVKRLRQIPINITGVSEIILNENGEIAAHYDHWDSASQLLRYIPIAGIPVRWVMRLFRIN